MYGEGRRGIHKHTTVCGNTSSPSAERSEYDGFRHTGSDSPPASTGADNNYCSIFILAYPIVAVKAKLQPGRRFPPAGLVHFHQHADFDLPNECPRRKFRRGPTWIYFRFFFRYTMTTAARAAPDITSTAAQRRILSPVMGFHQLEAALTQKVTAAVAVRSSPSTS